MKYFVTRKTSSLLQALVLIAAFLLSSCSHLRYLNQAQDRFNQGAKLENQQIFNPESEIADQPVSHFESAYASVKKALENEDALRRDNLLANAYKIKAYCEWKLMRYEEAEKSANRAISEYLELESKGIRMDGDKALMQALPHLMAIETTNTVLYAFHEGGGASFEAARKHYQEVVFDSGSGAAQLEAALQKLDDLRAQLRGNDDVAVYLISSQLAGLKTWSDALDFLRQSHNNDESLDSAAKENAWEFILNQLDTHLSPEKEKLLNELKQLLPDDEQGRKLIQYWEVRI